MESLGIHICYIYTHTTHTHTHLSLVSYWTFWLSIPSPPLFFQRGCQARNDTPVLHVILAQDSAIFTTTLNRHWYRRLASQVSLIGRSDFPDQWPELLPNLVAKLATNNFDVINGVMQTANSLFKRCVSLAWAMQCKDFVQKVHIARLGFGIILFANDSV